MKPIQCYTKAERHNTKGETIWAVWQIRNWMRQKAKFRLLSAGEISDRAPQSILATSIAHSRCTLLLNPLANPENWRVLPVLESFDEAYCKVSKCYLSDSKATSFHSSDYGLVWRWVMKSFGHILEYFSHFTGRVIQGHTSRAGWTITWRLHLFLWQWR